MTMHQHTREENLLKTYKNVLTWKRIVIAMLCGEIYSKNDKKMEQENGHKRKN